MMRCMHSDGDGTGRKHQRAGDSASPAVERLYESPRSAAGRTEVDRSGCSRYRACRFPCEERTADAVNLGGTAESIPSQAIPGTFLCAQETEQEAHLCTAKWQLT